MSPLRLPPSAAGFLREDQAEFVRWWRKNVQRAGGDRQSEKHLPRSAQMLSFEDAESLTGIKHQQVSQFTPFESIGLSRFAPASISDIIARFEAKAFALCRLPFFLGFDGGFIIIKGSD